MTGMKVSSIAAILLFVSAVVAAATPVCEIVPLEAGVPVGQYFEFRATCAVIGDGGVIRPVPCPPSAIYNWHTDVGSITAYGMLPVGVATATFLAQTTPAAGTITADFGSFECEARVYVRAGVPSSCALEPQSVALQRFGSQLFTASCADSYGNAVNCPLLGWGTDVFGGTMNPIYDNGSSTLTVGGLPQLDKAVWAQSTAVSPGSPSIRCEAQVSVVLADTDAVSCSLLPPHADVPISGSQQFDATCLNALGAQVQCPVLGWSTTVSGGSMNPLQSPDSSVLTVGNALETDKRVRAAYEVDRLGTRWIVHEIVFMCEASVDVVAPPQPATCALSPNSADVPVGGTQYFAVSCLDQYGASIACPTMDFTTDVTGGSMNPTRSGIGSTLTAGNVVENNRAVTATYAPASAPFAFSCTASVDIIPQAPQVASCALSPNAADVPVGGTQYFAVSCSDQYGSVIACPLMNFITDVTGGSMSPSSSDAGSTLTAGNTVESGKSVISMHFDADGSVDFSCNASVNVIPGTQPPQPYCTLSPASADVLQNGTQYFSVSCFEADGSSLSCDTMSWSTTVTDGSMSPSSSAVGSTLTAGNTLESGMSVTATSSNYACSATVNVVDNTPSSCSLSPASVSVGKNGLVDYIATCYAGGVAVSCPALAWSTDVTGGWMDPLQSMGTSTLHAGATPETGRHVVATAPNLAFSCSADVAVVDSDIVSCTLSPSYVEVLLSGSQSFSATCYRADSSAVSCPTMTWATTLYGAYVSPTQSSTSTAFFAGNYQGLGTVTASTSWFTCHAGVKITDAISPSGGGGGYYYYGPYGPAPIPGTSSFSPAPSPTPKPVATAKATPTPTVRGTYHTPWTPPQITPTPTPGAGGAGGLTGLFTAFAPGSWLEILIAILALGGSAYLIRKMAAGA
ncbi:hypothetical protein COT29_01255 [Candidatus Micrarchaeota archaeon CG08_land_8_20_14_0_20_59_11]|nr:MAG: hypothetical protein COT29_01255 [Candidatus Micrarchaeota archaeon CG08_land_8_20_14_0_20_59_11]